LIEAGNTINQANADAQAMRRRPPNRREHEAIAFTFRGHEYTAGVGRFVDGALAELFLDCAKVSTPLAADARDAAVCLSLALQYGVPVVAIREAVSREADGSPAGIIGATLDLLTPNNGVES
jgi:hypothetical protein